MTLAHLTRQIKTFRPINQQEQTDQAAMLEYIARFKTAILRRDNLCTHFTASAFTVNPARTKMLMIHHNIYDCWTWQGGHADGATDLRSVAIRELKEETGAKTVKLLSQGIASLEILAVTGHVRQGIFVPSHTHLNLTYLLEVDDHERLKPQLSENTSVKWVKLDQAIQLSRDDWVKQHVWQAKVMKKLTSRT